MALTLDCVCPDSGALTCTVTKLEWVIEAASASTPDIALTLELTGGPVNYTLGVPWVAQSIDLGDPAPWMAAWDSLAFIFSGYRSVSSDVLESVFARHYIKATFACGDGSDPQEQRSHNTDSARDVCSRDGGITVDALGQIGEGAVAGYIRHTRPLADCFGFSVTGGHLSPKPKDIQTVDMSSPPESLRLCPSGGTPPYIFGISEGSLPSGMTIDGATGAITGTPDGMQPGTPEVVCFVFDADHNFAQVTCSFLATCKTVEEFGNTFY